MGLALSPEKVKTYKDFRKLLEHKDIDAVIVATPEHWHAIPMIAACEAGKDVYVEKPISHTILEGRRMVEAANKHNRVVQCGTQQRSGEHFQKVAELLRKGSIGRCDGGRHLGFARHLGAVEDAYALPRQRPRRGP